MITIDEIESEVVVEGDGDGDSSERSPEVERERLRRIVRELLHEEIHRFLRTAGRT
ncbi:MAG: hypothetical protein KC619_10345 [Myxococcales bacterium]|nr:hypothetical protein [Myxococcales bacterium]